MNNPLEKTAFENLTGKEARVLFLEALDEVEPDILRVLRDQVFPHYDSDAEISWQTCLQNPSCETLREALTKWAGTFKIDFPWIYQAALRNLWVWFVADPSDISGAELIWHHALDVGRFSQHRENLPDASISLSWDPARESEESFRARTLADFERMLDRYIARKSRTWMQRTGQESLSPPAWAPFHWLALHRVKALSPEDIAALYSQGKERPEPAAIREALTAAENLLREN